MPISIMLCTRQRPQMLKECIASLIPQIQAAAQGDMIVVIENDDTPATRALVEELGAAHSDVPIHYRHEPQLGIPIARNTGVEASIELGADWLAFVDDDETVDAGWLEKMRIATQELGADAITGPVNYIMPEELPLWMDPPKKKKRTRGEVMRTAATNNTLVRADWFTQGVGADMRFDEKLRFTGGSDTEFFHRFTEAGGKLVWVDDATVSEVTLPERLTMGWQLARARRTASNAFRSQEKRKGRGSAFRRYIPKAVGRILRGLIITPLGALIYPLSKRVGLRMIFKGRKAIASAIGSMQGAMGIQPQPYKKVIGH